MLPYRDSRFTIIALFVFFSILAIYAYFEARNALYGPRIDISETRVVHERFIHIEGQAKNIAELRVNGNPVAVTEAGAFKEPHLLAPGYNRIVLEARDSYGRSREKVLEITYDPSQDAKGAGTGSTTSTEALRAHAPATSSREEIAP